MMAARVLIAFSFILGASISQILDQPVLTLSETEDKVIFSVVALNNTLSGTQTDPMEANSVPFLQLFDPESKKIEILMPFSSRNYTYKFTDTSSYIRTSHFFSAKVIRGRKYIWSVTANNTLGPFHFKLRNYDTHYDTRMIVLADMDNTVNAQPTWQALSRIDLSTVDALVHAGDFAYNVNSDDGRRGDLYFNSMANIVTEVPYLIIAGNHEAFDGSKFLNYRFRMPQYKPEWDNNVYTVLENNALFLFINYDWFLKGKNNKSMMATLQYTQSLLAAWEKDPRVRWRVVVSHRPLYCGHTEKPECQVNPLFLKPFEDTYRKYKVDVFIAAHEHIYERLKVLNNFEVVKQPAEKRAKNITGYSDPTQPIMVVNGLSGGEKLIKEWETHNINDYNFAGEPTYLDLRFNEDHFEVRCVLSSNGVTIDGVRIAKTTPFEGSKKGFLNKIPVAVFFVAFLLVIAGAYFLLRYLSVKNDERRRSLSLMAHSKEDRLKDAEAMAGLNSQTLDHSSSMDNTAHKDGSYI